MKPGDGETRRGRTGSPEAATVGAGQVPDTSAVVLPESVVALVELLAEHVHDTWARRRRAEGWRYGDRRDDDARTHPGLVPFADLPESEKAYDRGTVLETLRALRALGFRILGPEERDGRSGLELPQGSPHGP